MDLTDRAYSAQISNDHLEIIVKTCCTKWRLLSPQFQLQDAIENDKDEQEEKSCFFYQWKQRKGSEATYKALIIALQSICCQRDAEFVCELIDSSSPGATAATKGLI